MSNEAGHDGEHEIHPPSYYIKIYLVLLVLLVISLIGPELGIKVVTLITAFGIAFVKAYIVAQKFMHLELEQPIVKYILGTCCVFMVLFFAGTSPDVMNHAGTRWTNQAAHNAVLDGLREGGGHGAHGAHGDDGHGDDGHGDDGHGAAKDGHGNNEDKKDAH